jgi:hypothetical protein
MLFIVALVGTYFAVYFGLFPKSLTRQAYEATGLSAAFSLTFYLTATAIVEAWKFRRGRSLIPVPNREQVEQRQLLDAVRDWLLQNALSERKLHVHKAFLFGSITHDHYATSDVDLAATVFRYRANEGRNS